MTFSANNTNNDSMLVTNNGLHRAMDAYYKEFGVAFTMGDVSGYTQDVISRLNKTASDGNFLDLVIVVDQLLTGFDAPICQVLYIDKQLKEHGLLQAIARTNRLYEGKDYGLIVDYRGLLPQLNDAMNVYSGDNGLDRFDKKDLEGLITDVLTSVAGLRQAYTNLENNFISIENKNDEEEYELSLIHI